MLFDEYPLVRQGLKAVLESRGGISVCGLAGDLAVLLDLILKHKPEIAVVGIAPPTLNGLNLVSQICDAVSDTRVLVLAVDDEPLYAQRALQAGARGFLPKHSTLEDVESAIWTLADGEIVVTKETAEHILQQIAGRGANLEGHPVHLLSKREVEVFEMTGLGMSRQEIAQRLSLATKTVDAYRDRVKTKLHLGSMPELVRSAIRWVEHNRTGEGFKPSQGSRSE